MAKNGRPGHGRIGPIKERVQVFNPKIKRFVEIDTSTHRFINVKADDKPFKDVRHYKPKGGN